MLKNLLDYSTIKEDNACHSLSFINSIFLHYMVYDFQFCKLKKKLTSQNIVHNKSIACSQKGKF